MRDPVKKKEQSKRGLRNDRGGRGRGMRRRPMLFFPYGSKCSEIYCKGGKNIISKACKV